MSGCKAGELFGSDLNPIAGVMIGILATVLLQSSSTTTSIIVTLVGSAITVNQGIFMVMGANIGTSMTSTIVAMGQMGNGDQLERGFAGATVHDMYNIMMVAILLPVEVITGYLEHLTGAMVKNAEGTDKERWEGPIARLVEPLGALILMENKDVTFAIAEGEGTCGDYYPMDCDPAIDPPTYESCGGEFGLIKCDEDTGCPAFFNADATPHDDKVAGGVVFFIGIMIIFACMVGLVTVLQKLLSGKRFGQIPLSLASEISLTITTILLYTGLSTPIMYKATSVNGYVAIAIGAGITMIVQSSSITTSTLTPFVGIGALRLEQMLPLTLGANLGTTLTGILAALVSDEVGSLQVALAHLFFNVTGVLIFYPIPFMRNIPLWAARRLGKATRIWRGFPLLYLAVMFGGVPLFFLGVSSLFQKKTTGLNVLGSFIVIVIAASLAWTGYWWVYKDGRAQCGTYMAKRERVRTAIADLPDDMESLMERVAVLEERAGIDAGKNKSDGSGTHAGYDGDAGEVDTAA